VKIALFGHPVGHSRSADLFRALRIAGGPEVQYEPVDVPPGGLADAARRIQRGEFRGANVTVPHKVAAAALADELDPAARAIGAVNVLAARVGGGLYGANTDARGFFDALLAERRAVERLDGAPPRVAILGAGGAARAVAWALLRQEFDVLVVARDTARVRAWPHPLAVRAVPFDDPALAARVAACPLVVQATPLGTWPDVAGAVPLGEEAFRPEQVVVDLVYNPWQTRLLERVRQAGALGINGWPMLVRQAAAAAELWFGPGAGERLVAAARLVEDRDPADAP
jgi:shikimate dehydrogenase